MSPELTEFLSGIATDPDKLKGYIDDPDAALQAAGVPEAEKEIMKNNEFSKLGALPTIMIFVHVQGVRRCLRMGS